MTFKLFSIFISRKSQKNETVIESTNGWFNLNLRDLWNYRELIYFLTWRDIKVRYKQTFLGVVWAILQPLLAMAIFSLIFGKFAELPSDGVPYPIFTYAALLPWQLFSYALNQSSMSLISDQNLIKKVYFPRLVIPISSIVAGLIDFSVAFVILVLLMVFYRIELTSRILILPLVVTYVVIAALSIGLWLSALNVKYRDVRYALPFLTQAWLFATPIAYSTSLIPEKWKLYYSLNPMTGVVELFRWALLGKDVSISGVVLVSGIVIVLLFSGGLIYFKNMEERFADII